MLKPCTHRKNLIGIWSYFPVDCQWSSWTYGECSKSCGKGKRGRTRTKAVTEKFGGTCDGPSFVYEDCVNQPCPGVIFKNNQNYKSV